MPTRWAMAALLAISVAGCVPPYGHHRHHDGWGWNDRDHDRDHDHDNDGCRRQWCDDD
jgi:hypothetical protein